MTQNQRRKYSREFQNMIKTLEERFAGSVYNAIRRQVRQFTNTLREQGVNAARYHVDFTPFNEELEDVVKRMYTTAGVITASKVRRELRLEEQKRFGKNDELIAAIQEYLSKYILDKSVRPISQTTRDWVLRRISEGVEQGKGAAEIARWIMEDDGNIKFLKNQALRIVRTETVRAANVGAMKAGESGPFVTIKEWIAAHDNRTRHSHRRVDGEITEFSEPFSNGLMQPGDPKGDASETINCRCTVAVKAKRDENGRLIRRTQTVAA